MSSDIVDKWMEKVRGRNNENSSVYSFTLLKNIIHRYTSIVIIFMNTMLFICYYI